MIDDFKVGEPWSNTYLLAVMKLRINSMILSILDIELTNEMVFTMSKFKIFTHKITFYGTFYLLRRFFQKKKLFMTFVW